MLGVSLAIEGVSCLWVHPTVSDTCLLPYGKSKVLCYRLLLAQILKTKVSIKEPTRTKKPSMGRPRTR